MTDRPRHDTFTPQAEDRLGFEPSEPAARAAADERSDGRDGREAPRLGRLLREAREQAGLGLSDMAEVTHVRRVYLVALEEGRYNDLPEDVYARNFVRLFANAVGLDAGPLLERYARERQQALGFSTLEQRLERDRRSARAIHSTPTAAPPDRRRALTPAWLAGPLLPTLALVVVVVGLAVWGFNGLFASGTPRAARPAAQDAAAAPAGAGADTAAAAPAAAEAAAEEPAGPSTVRVDIVTDPPGATITIDGYAMPYLSPVFDLLVTPGEGRLVRAELDGYQPGEVRADLDSGTEVTLTLVPLSAAADDAAAGATPAGAPPVAGDGRGPLTITITDTTWLEVYRSTERNQGDRLVFTTAQSGQSYQFEPPVYVYTGNAAGVRLVHGGQDLGPMGSPGAVLGRAFPE